MEGYLGSTKFQSAVLGVVLIPVAGYVYYRLTPKPIPNIPHNPIKSMWGDVPDVARFIKEGGAFSGWVSALIDEHGPICQMLLGNKSVIIIADRLEVERLLLKGKNTNQCKRTNEIFATVIPYSQISQQTNEIWKRHRRLTGPSMSQRYLGRISSRISAGASNLARFWAKKVELAGNVAFDADIDLQLATMDMSFDITTGVSSGCVNTAHESLTNLASTTKLGCIPPAASPPFHAALRTIMEGIARVSQSVLPSLAALLFVRSSPTWRQSYNMLSTFCNNEIANARMREDKAGGSALATDADCVVDMIIQREAREGAEKFEKGELLDELLTYILGGNDSTSAALRWLVKYLPLDLDIQQRLHQEVCTVFGADVDMDAPLDFEVVDDSDRVPILEAVVAETLRCAGVGTMTSRELMEDEVILGRRVPKGIELMFPVIYMNKQESEWGPDAKIWRPSRWLRPDGSFDRMAGSSIPFGIGQRSCFGQRLAVLQIKIVLATLSRAFVFKPVPAELGSWDAIEHVTRRPKHCFVSLESWPTARGKYA